MAVTTSRPCQPSLPQSTALCPLVITDTARASPILTSPLVPLSGPRVISFLI